ncbi:Alpha/beta hydrolase family protein [Spironucleus salmonicida]|uniref:Alpha/beta hydrolase n=1 Tax=Spironucleus salmonicida TaxID=348837 RepID=V6LSV4_9EUKA|nr:Alpha/beta hydrolase family protein [Spironucleus salmonicida]|eukprot:EST47338.1 Alpha/beta hydrolase [Spironucleus salmonicida]
MTKQFEDVDWNSEVLDESKINFIKISPKIEIRYYRSFLHSENTPTILFVHGFGLFMDSYAPFILALNKYFNVIALDNPGHGYSSELANYSLDFILHAIQSFISHQRLTDFHIVGHSLGGYLAICLRSLYPGNCLVAITPAGIEVVTSPLIKLAKNKTLNKVLRGCWKSTFKAILSKTSQLLEFQLPKQQEYDDIWYRKHIDKHRKYVNSQLMYLRDFEFNGGEEVFLNIKDSRNLFILCIDDTYIDSAKVEKFVCDNQIGEVTWYDAIHQITQAIPHQLAQRVKSFILEK